MDVPILGQLETVDIKSVWSHEAHSFTPWLLANYDELAKVVGIDIELSHSEHAVGGFSLDLIGKDSITEDVVIIENQLEQSDHTHLGQILTYAAGTDAKNIIWVAPKFRDEHRAAIDWLNSRTDESTRFFAVVVSAVKIGDSNVAPRFELVSQPNDWNKSFKQQTVPTENQSEKSLSYQDFWGQFLGHIAVERPGWTNSKTPARGNWMNLKSGTSSLSYGLNFPGGATPMLRAEFYIFDSNDSARNTARYEYLLDRKEEIEAKFGGELSWEALPGKSACRIAVYQPNASVDETERWSEYTNWFVEKIGKLKYVFQDYVEALSKII